MHFSQKKGLGKMDLQDLFKEETNIPSLPEVFYRFREAVNDPDTSFYDMGEIIATDPGLTARLLKIVNSPFYGLSNKVETIPHAVSIVGSSQLNDLVISTCIIDRFKNISPKGLDMPLFWEHSIATGLSAKIIAKQINIVNQDSIFVGGLLHDIGRLVLCLNAPEEFSEIFLEAQTEEKSLLEVEIKILGFGHDKTGEELLRRWKLPKVHQETIGYHHNPLAAPLFNNEAAVVFIANNLAKSLALGSSGELIASENNGKIFNLLGIKSEEFLPSIIDKVQKEYEATLDVFLQAA